MPQDSVELLEALEKGIETIRGPPYSVDAARAVKIMADALDRVAGEEAVGRLIDRVVEALVEHLEDDESLESFVRDTISSLREIQQVTEAVVGAAAVALRAAERAAEGDDSRPEFSRFVENWEAATAKVLKQQDG